MTTETAYAESRRTGVLVATIYSRRRRARRVAEGGCVDCSAPAAPHSASRCERHLLAVSRVSNRRHDARRELGLCAQCGDETLMGGWYCERCRVANLEVGERYRQRRG